MNTKKKSLQIQEYFSKNRKKIALELKKMEKENLTLTA